MRRYQCCEAQRWSYIEVTLEFGLHLPEWVFCYRLIHCLDSLSRWHLLAHPTQSRYAPLWNKNKEESKSKFQYNFPKLVWSAVQWARQRCRFLFVYPSLRACLHEGEGPQVGEVTCGKLPHLTCKRELIKMRDYMDRQVTPPKRVTSPTWGLPSPCEQAHIL